MSHNSHFNTRNSAFSLMEMSVVIVIIALILGGIFVGRSMFRTSQLQAVVAEEQLYMRAINDFREKYLSLPGDFGALVGTSTTGADALWGAAATTAANCKITARTTATATCNGNADGKIGEYTDANTNYEQFTAWEHLRNAGLVNVTVNGLMTATYTKTPGTNIPSSRIAGAGWAITFLPQSTASTQAIVTTNDTAFKHVLWFGGASPSGVATNQTTPVITAAEALGLDSKIDDGSAGSGMVVAQTNSAGFTACTSSSQYSATTEGNICSLVFKTGF